MRGFLAFAIYATICAAADVPEGQRIYTASCASCHDNPAGARLPSRAALQKMNRAAILRALETGVMRAQGASLKPEQRQAVAEYLGARSPATPTSARCASPGTWNPDAPSWVGWGAGLENSRFAPPRLAGLNTADIPNLKLKWAFSMGDVTAVRSQPTVFSGRVFIGSKTGTLYAIDSASGCVYWEHAASAGINSTVTIGRIGERWLAFVGDSSAVMHAVDARTGEQIWQAKLDPHPAALSTGTPQFHDGVLYAPVSSWEEVTSRASGYVCCTFRGSVSALDAATGKLLWKTYTIDEPAVPHKAAKGDAPQKGPSGVGVWCSPTLDPAHGLIYVATGDNYSDPPTANSDAILALEMKSGRIVWSKQITAGDAWNMACVDPTKKGCPHSEGPDHDFGSSPILVSLSGGKRVLVAGQKSGVLYGLDPDRKGALLWKATLGVGGPLGGIQWGSAADSDRVYTALSDLAFTGPNKIDPAKGGGLFAYQISTGERLWYAPPAACRERRPCSPGQSAAVTAMNGAVFSGSLDGHLRAYDSRTGNVIWDFDTAREFQAVNGLSAKGGALDGPGPVIAGGMVYAVSGYGSFGAMPGNVLLAFGK